jgi:hypothetical protein
MVDRNQGQLRMRMAAGLMIAAMLPIASARAGSVDLGDSTTLDYKLTLAYGVAVRTKSPSGELLNGPIDPFKLYVVPTSQPGQPFQLVSFSNTGLPTTINFDDGDRNFKRGSLINNRASGVLEFQLTHENYGFVGSGDAFYDNVYHRSNDNDSPLTTNKTGDANEFTDGTRYYDGQRARLLEAYGYGDWNLFGDVNLNLRLGKHVVAYGESLFFPGISGAQGTADATKAFVPGAEIKQILLPTNQVSMQLGLTNDMSVLGYYKLDFKPNEIFPEGDYFSPSDAVGPGSSFVYGSANPLSYVGNCPGLLQNISVLGTNLPPVITPGLESTVCSQILAPLGNSAGAPAFIYSYRAADIRPSKYGQYGGGLKYQLLPDLNVGLYYLRYSDPNPTVQLDFSYAPFTTKPTVTTQVINLEVPTTYNVKYFDGIHLFGGSFSTVVGPFNVGGDVIYRQGAALPAQAFVSGVLSPIYTRGNEGSVQLSAIYATNPDFYFDDLAWVTEAGYHRAYGLDAIESRPGQVAVDDGKKPFYSTNAWGVQTLLIPTKHNIFEGWDLSIPVTFSALVKGTPELAGAFGALYGEGDQRLSVSFNLTYLQNLQMGLGYNFFFGDEGKNIGNSSLKANPYADRDYASFNIKYNL